MLDKMLETLNTAVRYVIPILIGLFLAYIIITSLAGMLI